MREDPELDNKNYRMNHFIYRYIAIALIHWEFFYLSPCNLTDVLLFLEMQQPEEVSYPGVGGNVGFPALAAVSQTRLDGHDGQLILIHRLKWIMMRIRKSFSNDH